MQNKPNADAKKLLPGRPRDPERDRKIIAAARKLLTEGSFDSLSFEAIAQMTGVTRATIYRRWPTKAHLVQEVSYGSKHNLTDVLNHEDIRMQVRAVIERCYSWCIRPEVAAIMIGLTGVYQEDIKLRQELHDTAEFEARESFRQIMQVHRESGRVRYDINIDSLFDLIEGSVIFRLFFSSLPSDEKIIDLIADLILQGIEPR